LRANRQSRIDRRSSIEPAGGLANRVRQEAVALTLAVGAMISVYRFAIFLITLYTTA
jgi:hypothetical protein